MPINLDIAVPQVLVKVAPNLSPVQVTTYTPMIIATAIKYNIVTAKRLAAWLAQLAHESGGFKYLEEIWGPTRQQLRYGIGKLAARLGNKGPKDGYDFRGRGWIQLTGKANYAKYGEMLGLDFIANPSLASKPDIAFLVAGLYWSEKGLNELADSGMFKAITKSINGGYNGLIQRIAYYRKAIDVLKENNYV